MSPSEPFASLLLDASGADASDVASTVEALLAHADPHGAGGVCTVQVVLHGAAHLDLPDAVLADPRVTVLRPDPPSGVREAVNAVRGSYLGFLDVGGRLTVCALDHLARLSMQAPEVDVLYTDEAVDDPASVTSRTIRKPAWSPERLLGQAWTGRLCLVRTAMARAAIANLSEPQPTETALMLAVAALDPVAVRLPEVAYHGPPRLAPADLRESVAAHLARQRVAARVEPGAARDTCRVVRALPPDVSVAVVIATSGGKGLAWGERRRHVVANVRALLAGSVPPRTEVVAVHASSTPPSVLVDLLAVAGDRLTAIPFGRDFDLVPMLNLGVLSTAADVVVLLDERAEVVSEDFLPQLIGPLVVPVHGPVVGATGPAILGTDGSRIDAGLALHAQQADPVLPGWPADNEDPGSLLAVTRECSALSRTALALRRDTFLQVGGLSEQFPLSFEIDLAFKLAGLGLSRVWVHDALLHLASDRPDPDERTDPDVRLERRDLRRRWRASAADDYVPSFGAWRLARDRREQEAEQTSIVAQRKLVL